MLAGSIDVNKEHRSRGCCWLCHACAPCPILCRICPLVFFVLEPSLNLICQVWPKVGLPTSLRYLQQAHLSETIAGNTQSYEHACYLQQSPNTQSTINQAERIVWLQTAFDVDCCQQSLQSLCEPTGAVQTEGPEQLYLPGCCLHLGIWHMAAGSIAASKHRGHFGRGTMYNGLAR